MKFCGYYDPDDKETPFCFFVREGCELEVEHIWIDVDLYEFGNNKTHYYVKGLFDSSNFDDIIDFLKTKIEVVWVESVEEVDSFDLYSNFSHYLPIYTIDSVVDLLKVIEL